MVIYAKHISWTIYINSLKNKQKESDFILFHKNNRSLIKIICNKKLVCLISLIRRKVQKKKENNTIFFEQPVVLLWWTSAPLTCRRWLDDGFSWTDGFCCCWNGYGLVRFHQRHEPSISLSRGLQPSNRWWVTTPLVQGKWEKSTIIYPPCI